MLGLAGSISRDTTDTRFGSFFLGRASALASRCTASTVLQLKLGFCVGTDMNTTVISWIGSLCGSQLPVTTVCKFINSTFFVVIHHHYVELMDTGQGWQVKCIVQGHCTCTIDDIKWKCGLRYLVNWKLSPTIGREGLYTQLATYTTGITAINGFILHHSYLYLSHFTFDSIGDI